MLITMIAAMLVLGVVGFAAFALLDRRDMDDRACHPAPRRPYTVADAHLVWQVRAGCDGRVCADKGAALDVLIEAGEIVPVREYPQWA